MSAIFSCFQELVSEVIEFYRILQNVDPDSKRYINVILCRRGEMFSGGQNLRALREQLGLTMRDVEGASAQIALRHGNDEFSIPPSRLSDVETKGVVPSIYRLYSLAVIYRRDVRELLSWYGIDLNG